MNTHTFEHVESYEKQSYRSSLRINFGDNFSFSRLCIRLGWSREDAALPRFGDF